jgi:hypothetical protein
MFTKSATLVIALLAVLAFSATSASAETLSPWWHLTTSVAPTNLPPEGEGTIDINATNLGDASVEGGAGSPITITDVLPTGLRAKHIRGITNLDKNTNLFPTCQLATLTCTFPHGLPSYGLLEIYIVVKGEGAESGELNKASVSGGETRGAQFVQPITVSEAPVPFGLQDNEFTPEEAGGTVDARAGSHPFQLTSTLILNQNFEPSAVGGLAVSAALPKNIAVKLPPGLVGNPSPIPRCTTVQFFTENPKGAGGLGSDDCPAQAAVGVATVTVQTETVGKEVLKFTVPIFNLEPNYGEPARFGFFVPEGPVPVLLEPSVRDGNGEDYGITVTSPNTTETVNFLSSEVTFWGVPGDPRHDNVRGWDCLDNDLGFNPPSCAALEQQHPPSFLTLPTTCSGSPLVSTAYLDSWAEPAVFPVVPLTLAMPTLDGCNQLPFSPIVQAEPTTDSASSPSGLSFNLDFHDEGLTSAEGLAQSDLNKTVVTLPEGFTIDPSAGVGLVGCTPADYAREAIESAPGAGCPDESKLGTVEIETPLLTQKIDGNIFIAQPYENPFPEPAAGHPGGTLVALYIVARNPETGVLIKLAGKVTPNPVTGELTTTFENTPQLPFDHFNFHFREGAQAPLITPSTCGAYTVQAELTPWSNLIAPLTDTSSFEITSGAGGGACPSGGAPPFNPGIVAGMLNNNAGTFSPFDLHLSRGDGDQEISGFSTNLPPGLTGDLTGIPFCPEANIEAARHKTGAEEEANPSCPAASEVGHTLVGTGVGAVLAYVPGKIYLGGPFDGAPFSLVSVTSAKVGPFDLGTVVLRFGLSINPYTAQVSVSPTSSEPIPTIIDGIVTHVRDIRVYIDRNNFTLNPTSCTPTAIASTLTAQQGASATISSSFQAASCANLKFAPKFAVSTQAKTSRASGASLHVDLTYPYGPQGTYADIARVKVELPKQLPSRLTTLQKACTAAQFEANPAGCPSPSAIGTAKAVVPNIPEPLQGPVYFVSHGGEAFPSLEIVLQGYGVKVILVGATFISKSGITSTTFKTVPDNPVTSFELTLPEGPYSALAANGNLCTQKLTMPSDFIGQNGAEIDYKTALSVAGCSSALSVVSSKVNKKTLTLSVYAPAAGKVTASGKGVSSGVKTYSGHEALTFTLKQGNAGKLKAKIKLSFTPTKGKKQAKSLSVRFKK